MSINFEELAKLRQRVKRYPAQYRQEFWGYGKGSEVVKQQRPACGTAGCLAYNVVANHGFYLTHFNSGGEASACSDGTDIFDIQSKATEILGLDPEQAMELFSGGRSGWSFRASQAYSNAKTPKERAAAAIMQIDDFVAKYRAFEAYGKRLFPAIQKYTESVGG
jgi:hypothetical protein